MARKRKARKASKPRKVPFIPRGYHSVTPYLACRDAARAIEFYKQAFGAAELMRMPGDSRIMLADEYREMDFLAPDTRGGTPVHLHVYVRDVDGMVERAVAAGAKLIRPIEDKFYGDRSGSLQDPFGHVWHLATHKEDLSKAQLRKRAEAASKAAGG